jgi:hypothetical protein
VKIHHIIVTPAKAGVSPSAFGRTGEIPAFAGMTNDRVVSQ